MEFDHRPGSTVNNLRYSRVLVNREELTTAHHGYGSYIANSLHGKLYHPFLYRIVRDTVNQPLFRISADILHRLTEHDIRKHPDLQIMQSIHGVGPFKGYKVFEDGAAEFIVAGIHNMADPACVPARTFPESHELAKKLSDQLNEAHAALFGQHVSAT